MTSRICKYTTMVRCQHKARCIFNCQLSCQVQRYLSSSNKAGFHFQSTQYSTMSYYISLLNFRNEIQQRIQQFVPIPPFLQDLLFSANLAYSHIQQIVYIYVIELSFQSTILVQIDKKHSRMWHMIQSRVCNSLITHNCLFSTQFKFTMVYQNAN